MPSDTLLNPPVNIPMSNARVTGTKACIENMGVEAEYLLDVVRASMAISRNASAVH